MGLIKTKNFLIAIAFLFLQMSYAQSYESYFTGDPENYEAVTNGGVCLMGGAGDNDDAVAWFIERANGGDVLVLRASGSDGYNDYFYSDFAAVNSVETIVFIEEIAAADSYIHERIAKAEAIWFAGGDQWNYVDYWRNTPIAELINEAVNERNIVIGGTSAGMAILGDYYFSAENGTVTSETALTNPYHENVTADSTDFLTIPYLKNTITDTHYDDPDRKGRHTTFLARMLSDYGVEGYGIACDEYTAVCIAPDGMATVFGAYPDYDDYAYFIQTNCELTDRTPELCETGTPLEWNRGGEALRVYKAAGTYEGSTQFNVNNWEDGTGGEWLFWSVEDGELTESEGRAPDCSVIDDASLPTESLVDLNLYPNPSNGLVQLSASEIIHHVLIFDVMGKIVFQQAVESNTIELNVSDLMPGIYQVAVKTNLGVQLLPLSLF